MDLLRKLPTDLLDIVLAYDGKRCRYSRKLGKMIVCRKILIDQRYIIVTWIYMALSEIVTNITDVYMLCFIISDKKTISTILCNGKQYAKYKLNPKKTLLSFNKDIKTDNQQCPIYNKLTCPEHVPIEQKHLKLVWLLKWNHIPTIVEYH